MILDTSFLIDLMDGDSGAVAEAERLEAEGSVQRVPARVIYELYVGVGYSDRTPDELRKIRTVIESRPIEPTTAEIAALAGRIDGRLQRDGESLSPGDLLIGATARRYGEEVLTGNPRDFGRIPDVAVRTYGD